MDIETFISHVDASPLRTHAAWFRRWHRPAVSIATSAGPVPSGGSRFGGAPDLPPDTAWPRHEKGPYRFLAQFNLAEVPHVRAAAGADSLLPGQGLLSLFVADDPTGKIDPECEVFWGDPRYALALLIDPQTALAPRPPAPEVDFGTPCGITFAPTIDIPFDPYQISPWPFTAQQEDAYTSLRERLHGPDYLFGYPTHCSLGYDPTPKGQLPLLTLQSSEDRCWQWHDGDCVMLFFDPRAVKPGLFSLGADAG